jgi:hypothetical protein
LEGFELGVYFMSDVCKELGKSDAKGKELGKGVSGIFWGGAFANGVGDTVLGFCVVILVGVGVPFAVGAYVGLLEGEVLSVVVFWQYPQLQS